MGAAPSKQISSSFVTWSEPSSTRYTRPETLKTRKAEDALDEKAALMRYKPVGRASDSHPRSAKGAIGHSNLSAWEATANNSTQRLARTILQKSDLNMLQVPSVHVKDYRPGFNVELDFKTGPIANQGMSGRCWLFASTNVLRYSVMRKLNLDDFQLSQNFLYFWDKLEKSNYFLETIIEDPELPFDSRLLSTLSLNLVTDGGQWDMAVNIWKTYGIVPRTVFPDSYHSIKSAQLNTLLKTKIREHALTLKRLAQSLSADGEESIVLALRAKKEELMAETYRIITATLGTPPMGDESFKWTYTDKNGKLGVWEGTPLEFYNEFIGEEPETCISLLNDPRNDYSKLFVVDKLGNVWGGRPVSYLNTTTEIMIDSVIACLKSGRPVFFGCDVLQQEDKERGILDVKLFDYSTPFNLSLDMTKAERVMTGDSAMTHAMVITAAHVDTKTGAVTRFKVENAWGLNIGDNGWFMMTADWFREFAFQVVVPPKFIPKELLKVFEAGNAQVLDAWDPMGALA
ncbi:peptidase C1B, bleomycin hydrolase [Mycena belliarum]|uniref:Cysteine proteinase 1, mitochondrial n=1 Tax=Mycena belliarum TaxID=1033014 RepID=A0AAD6XWX1_9AGAR|nr:peptidase C1B, bleomycin hydrolase [Mycena belliae]